MKLDQRTIDRVSGPAWNEIRPLFEDLSRMLLKASVSAKGELTTIYVKFTANETRGQPFAVVWLRSASQIVVGLSLPEKVESQEFVQTPKGCKYAGLTKYLTFKVGDIAPDAFETWASQALTCARSGE